LSLDLEKLTKQINEQLEKETRFSLTVWVAGSYWKTYGIKSIGKIMGLYLKLLIPLKIYKKIKKIDEQKNN
jgi:hypothetical protein